MKLENKLANNQPPEIPSSEQNIKSEYQHSGCARQLCCQTDDQIRPLFFVSWNYGCWSRPCINHFWVISPVLGNSPSFCPSICLSVTFVFQTFPCRPLRYWLEIWYMNCSWSWYRSNMTFVVFDLVLHELLPLLMISFPDFSFYVLLGDIDSKFGIWFFFLGNTARVRL